MIERYGLDMGIVNLVLLILGLVLVISGAIRLARYRAWVDGIVLVVFGLILLAVGGFINV